MPPQLHVLASNTRRGAETFATDLVAGLRERGRHVESVALPRRSAAGAPLDIEVLPGSRPRSPAALLALRRRARGAGVVVAHGSDTLVACALATAGLRTPFVYRMIGDPSYWSASRLRRVRVRLALGHARRVVVLSEMFVDAVRALHGVPRDRITVIPNGVDPERFSLVSARDRAGARSALQLPTDETPVVAYVGALTPEKRPLAAVEAALAIPGVHLVIAGDGPLRSQLPADPRVHATGSLVDVRPVYAAADAIVIPSRSEGLPAVAIEAGMRGVPIVATDVGAVRDVVVAGLTGIVVPACDVGSLARGLMDALGSPELGRERGRVHCVSHFGMDAVVDSWYALLDEVEASATR